MPIPFFQKHKKDRKTKTSTQPVIITEQSTPLASRKDKEFCEKWGVIGEMDQYPCWQQFSECLKSELTEGHYYKLLWQVQTSFELHDQKKSILLSNKPAHASLKNSALFDKPVHSSHITTMDQEGLDISERTHHNTFTFPPISQTEMKIWTGDNLMKLLNDIKQSLDIRAIYDIKHKFVKPMLVIIDEARKRNGHQPLPAHTHTLAKVDKLELEISKVENRPRSNSV